MDDKDHAKARAARARSEALSPERRSEIASEAAKARWSSESIEARTGDHMVVYVTPKGMEVDLRFSGETLWATQRQMAEMFDVTVPNVSSHLTRIFRDGELDRDSVVKRDLITASDGRAYKTMLYELEAVISLGMRVSSKKGTHFRIWSRKILKEYMTKGFVIDDERLKNPDGRPDFFDELLDRIRDIRSSERRMWTVFSNSLGFAPTSTKQTPTRMKNFSQRFRMRCTGLLHRKQPQR